MSDGCLVSPCSSGGSVATGTSMKPEPWKVCMALSQYSCVTVRDAVSRRPLEAQAGLMRRVEGHYLPGQRLQPAFNKPHSPSSGVVSKENILHFLKIPLSHPHPCSEATFQNTRTNQVTPQKTECRSSYETLTVLVTRAWEGEAPGASLITKLFRFRKSSYFSMKICYLC